MAINETTTGKTGIVFYTDGSCRPTNPGPIGWGAHGYLFSYDKPKKGSGNQTHILTPSGYVPKSEKAKEAFTEIIPISYFEMFGSDLEQQNSAIAELLGMYNALLKANTYPISTLTVYVDSEYVRRGVEEWYHTWEKNNWVRNDGSKVPNESQWKKLIEQYNLLKDKGVVVNIEWVKGHNGIFGNTLADKLANIGSNYSIRKMLRTECKIVPAEGYWSREVIKHPLISSKRMLFSTDSGTQIPGEYYLTDAVTDEDMIGKKRSEGSYSIVILPITEKPLEVMREYQTSIAYGLNSIILARIDKLYNSDMYFDLMEYGDVCFVKAKSFNLDLNFVDDLPVTKELRPAKLSMRAMSSIAFLKNILNTFRDITDSGVIEDKYSIENITSQLYKLEDKVVKGKIETSFKLRPEFVVGVTSLKLDKKVMKGDKEITVNLVLNFGIDTVERNSFKKLEPFKPTVYLMSWLESPETLRYVTIIKTDDAYGIYAGMYSNMVFI